MQAFLNFPGKTGHADFVGRSVTFAPGKIQVSPISTMKKYLRITEYVWMTLAILCAGVTVYFFVIGAQDDGVFAMMVTLFAGVMYSLRRRFNKMVQRSSKEEEKK